MLHRNVRSELVAFKQGLVVCAKSYYFKESSDDFINLKEPNSRGALEKVFLVSWY